ncbi:radical SAM protein [bacterium]|nr:radical SAM protein [bacterium]
MYTLVYSISNDKNPKTVYVNLTNKCTNDCVFCLRQQKDDVCGAEMWHKDDYNLSDIIKQFQALGYLPQEVVFCGYGEPFLKKDMLKAFSEYLRKNYPSIKIRVNTNGHANAIYEYNVVEEFKDLLDEVSISLNSDNELQYNKICQPKIDNAYNEVKKFIKACNDANINTVVSVVSGFNDEEINVKNCEKLAEELGVQFKNREFIKNGY